MKSHRPVQPPHRWVWLTTSFAMLLLGLVALRGFAQEANASESESRVRLRVPIASDATVVQTEMLLAFDFEPFDTPVSRFGEREELERADTTFIELIQQLRAGNEDRVRAISDPAVPDQMLAGTVGGYRALFQRFTDDQIQVLGRCHDGESWIYICEFRGGDRSPWFTRAFRLQRLQDDEFSWTAKPPDVVQRLLTRAFDGASKGANIQFTNADRTWRFRVSDTRSRPSVDLEFDGARQADILAGSGLDHVRAFCHETFSAVDSLTPEESLKRLSLAFTPKSAEKLLAWGTTLQQEALSQFLDQLRNQRRTVAFILAADPMYIVWFDAAGVRNPNVHQWEMLIRDAATFHVTNFFSYDVFGDVLQARPGLLRELESTGEVGKAATP